MKLIKLLFSINFLFVFHLISVAQPVLDSTNYFYLTYNSSNGYFKGSVAQVIKSSTQNNRYYFSNDTLITVGNKVYRKIGNDNKLIYDFDINLNDTFFFSKNVRSGYTDCRFNKTNYTQ
jgi:hypothetical protein